MNIKEYRIKSGYTQSEVANVLNIKQSSYSRKELGKRAFTTDEIKILKELFKVSIDDEFIRMNFSSELRDMMSEQEIEYVLSDEEQKQIVSIVNTILDKLQKKIDVDLKNIFYFTS